MIILYDYMLNIYFFPRAKFKKFHGLLKINNADFISQYALNC